jgi:hypothetical protein
MTEQIARAAARDMGNRSMQKAGRTEWNEQDYAEACAVFDTLWPREEVALCP